MSRLPANKDREGGIKKEVLPNGTVVWSATPSTGFTYKPMAGMTAEQVAQFVRTGKMPAGSGPKLTNEQVLQVVNDVRATMPTSTTNVPLANYAAGPATAPVTTTTVPRTGGGGGGGAARPPAASPTQKLLESLIEEAKNRQFDTAEFDVRQKYLAEQIAAARAAQAAAESQANLQYQALAQMAAQQQADALAGTGAAYAQAAGDIVAQGAAGSMIGGGMGAALQQEFAAQQIADEQAIRELGTAAGASTTAATALQQLLNQAATRDFGMAQTTAETALTSERLRALAAFEQQRAGELADLRLRRAAEIQRQQEEAARRAAAAAAARAKAAADAAKAAAENQPQIQFNVGNTPLVSRITSATGSQQVAKDPTTGTPLLDQNKKQVMQPWGTYTAKKTVNGEVTVLQLDTYSIADSTRGLAVTLNTIFYDQTGPYKNETQQGREELALQAVSSWKADRTKELGSIFNEAWSAPVSQGGLGLPKSNADFIKLALIPTSTSTTGTVNPRVR